MASTQQLKSRIRSVKSTKQITKAMQMVAASKMRRAQDATKGSAPYASAADEILAYLSNQGVTDNYPLFEKRPIRRRLIIAVAADKGLAGAYNSNVLKAYIGLLRRDEQRNVETVTIAVGRKMSQFASRLKGVTVIGSYNDIADHPQGATFQAILSTACDMFRNKEVDAVSVVYTKFVSSMTQTAEIMRLLPAGTPVASMHDDTGTRVPDANYEPSAEAVLDAVAYRLVGARLYQVLLDARASEHSMRMLAMKNATDNATDLADDLTLAMNKARQGAITQELSEISAGVEAMK